MIYKIELSNQTIDHYHDYLVLNSILDKIYEFFVMV